MIVVKCPKCGMTQMERDTCRGCGKPLSSAAAAAPSMPAVRAAADPHWGRPTAGAPGAGVAQDPAFDRDRFLLRQKLFTINAKYDVWDEEGRAVLFVERPQHFLRNLGAALGGLAAGGIVGGLIFGLASLISNTQDAAVISMLIAIVGFSIPAVGVANALWTKRHVTFYRDESKAEPLLEILQDKKFWTLIHSYTVREPNGRVLGLLRKNNLTDILRKKWVAEGPDGRQLAVAKEDLWHAIVSRVLTKLFPMNFRFYFPESDRPIGSFDRKFTILDRYVLDLSADPQRLLDRRIGLALGVMLDTGERR